MAKGLSEEELARREQLEAEREERRREKQLEKERREREEIKRLNAEYRAAKKARRAAQAAEAKNRIRTGVAGSYGTVRSSAGALAGSAENFFSHCGRASLRAESSLCRFADKIGVFAEKKYSLPVFVAAAFLCLWFTAFVGGFDLFDLKTDMQITFYQFYLCDFSAGFCSRVIVGAIVSLFLDTVSIEQMTAIANGAVIVSFVLFAFITGAVLRRGLKERAFAPVLFAVVLLFEPVIVQSNYIFLGTLDIYTLILFLLTLCSYGTPVFYIVAPVFSVLGMTVHYHYMFSFFPAVIALYVYDIFMTEKTSKRIAGTAGMCVTALTGGASFIYYVFFAKNHLKCTADEFYELMASRFSLTPGQKIGLEKMLDGNTVFRDYFDYYIFGYNKGAFYYDSGASFIDFLRRDRISRTPSSLYIKYFALVLPVLIAFAVLWGICAKKRKGSRKLPYIAFICIMLALFPELFISSDVPRWMSATLTCQFALLFAVYLRGDEPVKTFFAARKTERRGSGMVLCILLASIYVIAVMLCGRNLPVFY